MDLGALKYVSTRNWFEDKLWKDTKSYRGDF